MFAVQLSKNCLEVAYTVVLILFLFVIVNYYLVSNNHTTINTKDENGKPRSRNEILVDSVYFTTTTFSTVGYGDVLPVTMTSKLMVIIQQLVLFGLSLGLVTVACNK